ncbi:hypothetical protein RQP54_04230 [Curvibacter sp. APW13]|uniref:tetratricopeptide repeat protein n=1 Tax=Curvibacter sp. APW13 TaxID=3077236 RepID=UPI0028E07CA2|nr:hypothetical protein [Curvibacter sp. APW13]MDT8990062.1 hypothetical protein [Curvibacter sp. APW13]
MASTTKRKPALHTLRRPLSALLSAAFLVGTAWAATSDEEIQLTQLGTSNSGEFFLTPFRYIAPKPSAATSAENTAETQKRPTNQQRIVDLSNAGAYADAGQEGLALLAAEKPDDGLQLIIANSLAWSGRLKDATTVYQRITEEPLVDDALVGVANIQRWRGRDEVAAPIYRGVLAKNPDHIDAKNGLELAERELAPRTTIAYGTSADSSEVRSRNLAVTHRWRDDSGFRIFEIEGAAIDETVPAAEAPLREVTVRYQDVGVALRPTLELTSPTNTQNGIFGNLRLELEDDLGQIDIGRVNWGKYTGNANSLLARDTATHVGLLLKHPYAIGDLAFKTDYFNISDENTIFTTDTRLTSVIRPFGNNVKPYLGVETRQAKFTSPNYWSPSEGAGTLYGGLAGEWPWENWSTYAGVQVGLGLYGDAGTSWMLSGGAKYWITSNYALSFNLWGMTSTRASSEYRAHTANVVLEKIWR